MDTLDKVITGIVISVIVLITFILIFSNHRKAEIYNQINETNYTMSDFFWAEDQINSQTQTINLK